MTQAVEIFKSILQAGSNIISESGSGGDTTGVVGVSSAASSVTLQESVTSTTSSDFVSNANSIIYPSIPTHEGPEGIRYDFNFGLRVMVPEGKYRVSFKDLDTGTVFFEGSGSKCTFSSRKKYFIRGKIDVFKDDLLIFTHAFDAQDKNVAILMPGGTIGDSLGWFPYAVRFAKVHGCKLTVISAQHIQDLLQSSYPEINFILKSEFDADPAPFYATYRMGLFFTDEDNTWQPADFRIVGLHRTAGYILGVSPQEEPPTLVLPDERPIVEPYVVIATQASSQCKYWNNPEGWHDVVSFLKRSGYRVICIDKDMVWGQGLHFNQIPNGCENETGFRPLLERATWLKHAEFFVGLSSGLSWLAWAARTPVVMISGFTHPTNEFYTPYRVFNTHACNSCWHDIRHPFVHDDFLFCPRLKGTEREFECTRLITSEQVIDAIKRAIDGGSRDPAQESSLSEPLVLRELP